eukprot:15473699-Alexandrium_andersonii.AAC.1
MARISTSNHGMSKPSPGGGEAAGAVAMCVACAGGGKVEELDDDDATLMRATGGVTGADGVVEAFRVSGVAADVGVLA